MKKLGKYEILEVIGRGGFAAVYKARDPDLDRIVALKVLYPHRLDDSSFVTRFHNEAQTAANLRHPNIGVIYEVGEVQGQLYIAMEYLPGQTLQKLLEAEDAFSMEQTLSILEQVAEALDYAHGQGVVHRDIKPSNMIVGETSQGFHVTLMDFGLVKAMKDSTGLTSQGTTLGTPAYMAPEQVDADRADEIGPAADRYALGVVAYQMFTGRVPFPGNTPATLHAHLHKQPPDPCELVEGLSSDVASVLLTMLAKAPPDRFPTACAFVDRLRITTQHKQLQSAISRKDWAEVLVLSGQIQALAPDAQDMRPVIAQARRNFRQSWLPLPLWTKVVGGLILLALLAWIVADRFKSTGKILTVAPTPVCDSYGCGGDTWTRPRDNMVMVYVPRAEFQMGDSYDVSAVQPVHNVEISGFWIDQTEVTNAQFTDFVNAMGNQMEGGETWLDLDSVDRLIAQTEGKYRPKAGYESHPVVEVTWYGAEAYCEWVGGRLPTEAEWEYAARGPKGTTYPWGNVLGEAFANWGYATDGYANTAPVGSFPKDESWCKAMDMAGNVLEWVVDWYGDYPSEKQVNPNGPDIGEFKVVRGGSWVNVPHQLEIRSTYRRKIAPTESGNLLGFRCAKDSE